MRLFETCQSAVALLNVECSSMQSGEMQEIASEVTEGVTVNAEWMRVVRSDASFFACGSHTRNLSEPVDIKCAHWNQVVGAHVRQVALDGLEGVDRDGLRQRCLH